MPLWRKGLLSLSAALLALLFLPVPFPHPVTVQIGNPDGTWWLFRDDRIDSYRIDCELKTPVLELAHSVGDGNPYCGRFRTGWSHGDQTLAYVREGYAVLLRW